MIDTCSYFSYNRKIILYGTGENAKRFVEKNYYNIQIICCLDKSARSGEFLQFPIRSWDDVEPGTADCVVIAASDKNIREIYFRIIYNCDRNKLDIYDWRGVDLRNVYRYEYIPYRLLPTLKKDRNEMLKREIDNHDAISFDLFDTLIIRRTMEPEDVFKCVESELEDGCPVKKNFSLLRKECELKTNAVIYGFDRIYRQMEKRVGLKEHSLDYVAKKEIACERKLILPRQGMVEILEYAIEKGKKVNIISDMYLNAEVLKKILDTLGIRGYDRIFVSSDYVTSKSGDLYKRYKEEVEADSYLHIGDNHEADGESAIRCGMDFFLIPSGIELLRISSMRKILYYAKGDSNRRLIGECIAKLFNDPFCLCSNNAAISVKSSREFAQCFISPIVYKYLARLKKVIEHNKYDKVLLGARDGYIFNRIIKEVPLGVNTEKFIYLYISRVLAFQLGMGHPMVDADYKNYLKVDGRRKIDEDEEFVKGKEKVPYRQTKESYIKYLNELGVEPSGRYLFCDLVSGGTVQHSIQYIFSRGLDGFYLGRTFNYQQRKLSVVSLFERGEIPNDQLLVNRLETLMTSPESTVIGMNTQGEFLFDNEHRSRDELVLLAKIQDEIVEGVRHIVELSSCYADELDKMLAYTLLRELNHVEVTGELLQMREWLYFDNDGTVVKMFG